jgi:hypothetical protein
MVRMGSPGHDTEGIMGDRTNDEIVGGIVLQEFF